jgi:phage-related protein
MAQAKPDARERKKLHWVGNSLKSLMEFPEEVRRDVGAALGAAQFGELAENAKMWKGEGPGVFEVVERHDGNAFRAVYASVFERAIYVLHAFQKKSPDGGSRTDQRDIEAVRQALKGAKAHHNATYGG